MADTGEEARELSSGSHKKGQDDDEENKMDAGEEEPVLSEVQQRLAEAEEKGDTSPEELVELQRARIKELEEFQQQLLEELQSAEDRIVELEDTLQEQDEIIEESFRAADASRKSVEDETSALKEVIQMQQATMEKQEQLLQDSTEVIDNLSSSSSSSGFAEQRPIPSAPQSAPSGYGADVQHPVPPPGTGPVRGGPHGHRRAASEQRRPRLRPPQPPSGAPPGREDGNLGRAPLSHRGPRPPVDNPPSGHPAKPGPRTLAGMTPRGSHNLIRTSVAAMAATQAGETRLPRVLGN